MHTLLQAAATAFLSAPGDRRWRRGDTLLLLLALLPAMAPACETSSSAGRKADDWVLRVGSGMDSLPPSCPAIFAEIVERLGDRPAARAWIDSVIDSADASSLNIATLARLTSLTEQALLGRGLSRARIRLNDLRLPRQEPGNSDEIGHIVIHVGEERPAVPN